MKRLVIICALWAALLATPFTTTTAGGLTAQDPPAPVTPVTPVVNPAVKAVMTGPTAVAQPKTPIIIRTEGSIGKTLKFTMSPKIAQSFSFKDEQTNELVFLYVPEVAGVYSVALAAADATGKIDVAILQTTVAGGPAPLPTPTPTPGPNPDVPINNPLIKLYGDAAATDLAAGVGTKAQISTLATLYGNAAKLTVYNAALTKPQDVYETLHAAAVQQGIPDGALPSLRKAMAMDQKAFFNFPAGVTFATSPGGDKAARDNMASYFGSKISPALAAIAQ